MPLIANPNGNDPYQQVELTNFINRVPTRYNFIQSLGLFRPIGITTSYGSVDVQTIDTKLIKALPRGKEDEAMKTPLYANRKTHYFETVHLFVREKISRADFQDERAPGKSELETERDVIARRIFETKENFLATIEHMMLGCLQGRVLDADGSLLYDMYDEFNVTQEPVDFELATASTNTQAKCYDVTRKIDIAVGADKAMDGYMGIASDTWFNAFTNHANTKAAYAGTSMSPERLGGDMRRSFQFAGINIINYNPIVKDSDGNDRKFVEEGTALFLPVGTKDTFLYYMSPSDMEKYVNTRGMEFYAQRFNSPNNRAINLEMESNVLPICTKPDVLVKGTM